MAVYHPTGIKKSYHFTKRFLAAHWLSLCHPTQIAITGSQGKTSTTEIVTRVFEAMGNTVRTDVNLDTTFNVPITALKVRPWTTYLVWELGIDHPGEMDHHLEIAKPTISCITGISPVHTDKEHMGSLETLIKEKRRLIEVLPSDGTAVLNHDDQYVRAMASHTTAAVKWYGTTEGLDVWVDPHTVNITLDGTHMDFHTAQKRFTVQTGLIGTHHVYNLMAAFLLAQSATTKDITETFTNIVKQIEPLRGRMSVEDGSMETVLLNDSLRANPESTNAGLRTLEQIVYTKGRKIAVIGEMGELEHPEEEHRKTGELIAKLHLDYVIGIGPLRKHTIEETVKQGFPKEKTAYAADVFEATEILKKLLRKDDLWYLKGSLLRNYKRIIQLLNGEEVCCREVLCPYEHCGYND